MKIKILTDGWFKAGAEYEATYDAKAKKFDVYTGGVNVTVSPSSAQVLSFDPEPQLEGLTFKQWVQRLFPYALKNADNNVEAAKKFTADIMISRGIYNEIDRKEVLTLIAIAASIVEPDLEKLKCISAPQNDVVNRPSHYTDGKIEVIDFIEDKGLNFHRGNAVKYIARAGKKDPAKEVEDLKKARWYLDREIQRLEATASKICCAGTEGCKGVRESIKYLESGNVHVCTECGNAIK